MKKITVLLILFLSITITTDLFAQKFSVQGGFTMSSVQSKDDDGSYSDEYSNRPGFHIGLLLDNPISESLTFQTGALLNTKGFKYEDSILGTDLEFSINPMYVDIPLMFKYGSYSPNTSNFFGAVGGYFGIGVAGNAKVEGNGVSDSEDISWGSDESSDNLRRFDYGLSIGVGVETSTVIVSASYDLGLANIAVSHDNGTVLRNRALKLTAGFKF